MESHQLINQTSGETDYYTDPDILEAARRVMGGIDLDPASSAKANIRVNAKKWFGPGAGPVGYEFVDGLKQLWTGRVWLNHPFGRAEPACPEGCQKEHAHHSFPLHGNARWMGKLFYDLESGGITQALCITYAATSEAWFQNLLACPICFLHPRTNYYLPDGTVKKGVTKGSAIAYMGRDMRLDKFIAAFRPFGQIKVNP